MDLFRGKQGTVTLLLTWLLGVVVLESSCYLALRSPTITHDQSVSLTALPGTF